MMSASMCPPWARTVLGLPTLQCRDLAVRSREHREALNYSEGKCHHHIPFGLRKINYLEEMPIAYGSDLLQARYLRSLGKKAI